MNSTVRDTFIEYSTTFEGRVNYMYADIDNNITIGVGNLLSSLSDALGLQFVQKSDKTTPASQADITADWNAVTSAVQNDPTLARRAGHLAFEPLTHLWLPDPAIDQLVLSKADSFIATLKQTAEFSALESWPADAQLGLLSMAWAAGPRFGSGFPLFRASCASQDWAGAASNCHLNDATNPGLTPRNTADRVLFLNADFVVSQGLDPTTLQYVVSGSRATIRQGNNGDNVTFLQTRLSTLAYLADVTGTFDATTDQATRAFQTDQALTADGVVGLNTWAALGTCRPAHT